MILTCFTMNVKNGKTQLWSLKLSNETVYQLNVLHANYVYIIQNIVIIIVKIDFEVFTF